MNNRRSISHHATIFSTKALLNLSPFQIIQLQNENRALRLRDVVTSAQFLSEELSASTSPHSSHMGPIIPHSFTSPRLSWDYFDEQGYIRRGGLRTGEDPYIRNRFNQQASDSIPSNRDIPDTRNTM